MVVVSELLDGTPVGEGYGADLGGSASIRRLATCVCRLLWILPVCASRVCDCRRCGGDRGGFAMCSHGRDCADFPHGLLPTGSCSSPLNRSCCCADINLLC